MNGVTIPGVSAGSNHVGTNVICAAHVTCPTGASDAAPAGGTTASATDRTSSDARRLMAVALDRLRTAPHDGQDRGAVLRPYCTPPAVRPVVHFACRDRSGLVRVGALEHEDQLVANVPMGRQGGARLELGDDRAALLRAGLVLPDPLLAHARARLDPRQLAQREDLRRRPAGPLRERLDAARDDRQHRGPIGRRHRVDAAVGPVAHVARRDRAELVRDGALDDEDQLIAGMPVQRELGARRDPGHRGAPLGLRMLPDALAADARLALLPRQIAERDDARSRSRRGAHGVLLARVTCAGEYRAPPRGSTRSRPRYLALSRRSSYGA